jgi:cellulose synthase/poly-beta-1,6-N-acetylglucosamine synthase-like glycosyltransferase
MIFTLILFSLASLYFAAGILLFSGTLRLRRGRNRDPLRASVVVAVRDGRDTIGDCLDALLEQSYPQERHEVIVVDDGSTDGTYEILKRYKERHRHLKIMQVQEGFGKITGKQRALAQGIRLAQGEIVLLTDADCAPPRRWIEEAVSYFEPEVGAVVGYALPERSPGIFEPVRSADLLFLQAVAAGFVGWGRPLSGIGKNLAIRKAAYREMGGFERMGLQLNEDMALIQKIHRETQWRTVVMQGRDACVHMQGRSSLRAFLRRRRRWLLAGFRSHPALFAILAFVFWTHVMLLASLLFLGQLPALLVYYSCLVVTSADFVLIAQGATMTRRYDLVLAFPMFQAFFWIYTTLLGLGLLVPGGRTIEWRGRTYG